MFSGRPNFSLRNKKLTRRRSLSGATSMATYGASQAGIFATNNNNNTDINTKTNKFPNKEKLSKQASIEISRPASVSSLGPQLTQSLPPIKMSGKFSIKIDISLFLSSPEGTPSVNEIRGKPEMSLFEVTAGTTCGQLLPQVIDRVIQSNPSNAKRDPNLFYIASVDVNTEAKELRSDISPIAVIQKSIGLISHFKLQMRPGTVIKVYSNFIVPGCEYKTLSIDNKTRCKEVTRLVLQSMRVQESIDKFSLQAFSPSIGVASCRIPLDQDDLALSALAGCGYEFCFILVREPSSEPQKRARFSKQRAKLSNEELRSFDSPDVELDDFSNQKSTKSNFVGKPLMDGPSLNNLELTDSLVSLTGLSFVSVDSNTDSSQNSFDETPCPAKQDKRMLPLPNLSKNSVSRSHSSPLYVKKDVLEMETKQVGVGEDEPRTTTPISADLFLTPDSNLSPISLHKSPQLVAVANSSNTSSPLPILRFPPPPPFDPISLSRGEESPNTTLEQSHFSKYNLLSPTEQDSGIGSPPQDTPPQAESSSFPSESSLASTGTTPSLVYTPGTLLYDLSVSSQQCKTNPALQVSLFAILKEFDVFTVEVVNDGKKGIGISLFDTGTGLLAVHSILDGGVIQREGSIQQDDRIIEVNNKVVIGASERNVIGIIRNCIGPVKLVMARPSKIKSSTSADAILGSEVAEEEIDRLTRALKASKPVLSRLRQKNSCLHQQVTDMKKSVILLNREHNSSVSSLEAFEKETNVLSLAMKSLSQSGKIQLKNQLEIAQLETIRHEISRFCEEVHGKLATAKDKLKLAISQASSYKRENEQLTNDLNAIQSELEKEKLNYAKHKSLLDNIQSSACIDCKVKDKEIESLRTNKSISPAVIDTHTRQDSFENKCENCQEKDSLLEQLENELTDKMLLIADQEAKLHTLRNRN